VGDDQKQHLELTRDIAAKFNHDSGQPAPEPLLACSPGHTWSLRWSSESTRYEGSGVVNPDTDTGWMFPAQTAVLLVAVPASARGETDA
jgi:tryptophanyl-tRNA synthetase